MVKRDLKKYSRAIELLENYTVAKTTQIIKEEFGSGMSPKTLYDLRGEHYKYSPKQHQCSKEKKDRAIELLKMMNNSQTRKILKKEFKESLNWDTLNKIREENQLKPSKSFNLTKKQQREQTIKQNREKIIQRIENAKKPLTSGNICKYQTCKFGVDSLQKYVQLFHITQKQIKIIEHNIKKINRRGYELGIMYPKKYPLALSIYLTLPITQKEISLHFKMTDLTLRRFFNNLKISYLDVDEYRRSKR